MDNKEFDNIKAGDKVILITGFTNSHKSIVPVSRVTATQILVKIRDDYEVRYWKKNGDAVGDRDRWSSNYIRLITPELMDSIEVEKLKDKAQQLRNSLGIPQTKEELLRFIAALEPLVKQPVT